MLNNGGKMPFTTGKYKTRKELTDTIWKMKEMGKKIYDICVYCKVSDTVVRRIIEAKEGMPEPERIT